MYLYHCAMLVSSCWIQLVYTCIYLPFSILPYTPIPPTQLSIYIYIIYISHPILFIIYYIVHYEWKITCHENFKLRALYNLLLFFRSRVVPVISSPPLTIITTPLATPLDVCTCWCMPPVLVAPTLCSNSHNFLLFVLRINCITY